MKQYIEHLKLVKAQGTEKPEAREKMPETISHFGYQNEYNLQEGFPLVTTKKVSFKTIIIELLWFLRGDSNIRYMIENNCNIWNKDAYRYYVKRAHQSMDTSDDPMSLEEFEKMLKTEGTDDGNWFTDVDYVLGDTGYQYPKVWRHWKTYEIDFEGASGDISGFSGEIDQIRRVIDNLISNPQGRRHIVTAVDPAHDNELALYWCHSLFQFNARPLSKEEKVKWLNSNISNHRLEDWNIRAEFIITDVELEEIVQEFGCPKYALDCKMYQRSADMVLGVPFNIASYALLTHVIGAICNMEVGRFIHTFGDAHIYNNHLGAVDIQLDRDTYELPQLELSPRLKFEIKECNLGLMDLDDLFKNMVPSDFILKGYESHPPIKAKLSTGL